MSWFAFIWTVIVSPVLAYELLVLLLVIKFGSGVVIGRMINVV